MKPARAGWRMNGDFGRSQMLVTTTNDVAGYRIARYLGLVRGITVRSRSVVGNFGAAAFRFAREGWSG